ncbi:MAG TPA: DUF4145 domain-containing protein [Methylibium sp.]|nr:DUF4145 domain-containing protein [Methylibium sp.]
MANNSTSWTCPYCNRVATVTGENVSVDTHAFEKNNKLGQLGLRTWVTICPNHECREFTITASLFRAEYNPNLRLTGAALQTWNLKPQSRAKPFPDYIPAPILSDYNEACLIRDLSPKASATLSRRCLQGMIRDFWGISKARLVDEIAALEGTIDGTTWGAIDAVRKIGNIGAHMERDISLIVEVDPEEAAMLIELIEVLLEEWYVRRHERNIHMQKIVAAAQAKGAAKASG